MKNTFKEIEVNINAQGVCEITLNRPDKHNAMNRKMIDELEEVGQHLKSQDSIRVVFLQSNGKTFCAGGDLNWMRDQEKKLKRENWLSSGKYGNNGTLPYPFDIQTFGGALGLISVLTQSLLPSLQIGLTKRAWIDPQQLDHSY